MAKLTFRKRSQAAKKGWETRRENLRRLQAGEVNRRDLGEWYRKQIDRRVEQEVKKALEKERRRHQRELAAIERRERRPKKKTKRKEVDEETKRLRAQIRKLKRMLREEEKISESPRRYIEKTIEKLWDKYGRDGGAVQIQKTIDKLAKKFSWPADDLWHWYFSPTWT